MAKSNKSEEKNKEKKGIFSMFSDMSLIGELMKDPGNFLITMLENKGPETEKQVIAFMNQQEASNLQPGEHSLQVLLRVNRINPENEYAEVLVVAVDSIGAITRVIIMEPLLNFLKMVLAGKASFVDNEAVMQALPEKGA